MKDCVRQVAPRLLQNSMTAIEHVRTACGFGVLLEGRRHPVEQRLGVRSAAVVEHGPL